MAIANTVIQLKKSGASGHIPVSLNIGETALNYADGKLFYLNSSGSVSYFYGQNNGPSFATANAAGTLILTTVPNDTLSFAGANGITITGNSTSKTITIDSGTLLANTGSQITTNGNSIVYIANTTASSSNTTGALKIAGGVGVVGNVYANSIYTNGLYYAANGNPISTGSSVVLSDSISSNSSANAATSNAVYIAVSTALAFSIALG